MDHVISTHLILNVDLTFGSDQFSYNIMMTIPRGKV